MIIFGNMRKWQEEDKQIHKDIKASCFHLTDHLTSGYTQKLEGERDIEQGIIWVVKWRFKLARILKNGKKSKRSRQ